MLLNSFKISRHDTCTLVHSTMNKIRDVLQHLHTSALYNEQNTGCFTSHYGAYIAVMYWPNGDTKAVIEMQAEI